MKRFVKKLYCALKSVIGTVFFCFYIGVPRKKTVFLLGTPSHNNIGDSAIVVAELLFLKNEFNFAVKEITTDEFEMYRKIVVVATKDKLVFLHGGGNMGDLWYKEEMVRRDAILYLRPAHFIIFPQTIFYSNTGDGKKKKSESIPIYSSNKITMFARERISYEIMKKIYPNAEISIVPDIVCYLKGRIKVTGFNSRHNDILIVFRSDIEKLDSTYDRTVLDYLKESFQYSVTDMYSVGNNVSKRNRIKVVINKLKEFNESKVIITDRLHGMIFAYLLDKPCLVFDINNHKISGTFDMLANDLIKMHNPGAAISTEIGDFLSKPTKKTYDIVDYCELIRIIEKYAHN